MVKAMYNTITGVQDSYGQASLKEIARKQGGITESILRLEKATFALAASIDTLETALSPALSMEQEGCNKAAVPVTPSNCNLSQLINGQEATIHALTARVTSILNRLEV